jgi:hypothetical protein
MKGFTRLFILLTLVMLFTSGGLRKLNYKSGMYKNVCKDFKNEVLAYFVFVDSKETMPWTEFDIRSTLDSINVAVNWLNQQAVANKINLRIRANYYIGKPYTPVRRNLNQGTIEKTIKELGLKKGLKDINLWADGVAKKVGSTFNLPDKDGIPEIKNPRNKERLVAYLRDENSVESVALILMVNNYYRVDISLPVNIYSSDDVEFSIVSYKYPAEIAHNILLLYGASPLYKSVYRKNEKKIEFAKISFPNEIMQDPYAKSIKDLTIGPLTQYLIGWTDKLDPQYHSLLTDGFVSF